MSDKNQTGTSEGSGIVNTDNLRVRIIVTLAVFAIFIAAIAWFKYVHRSEERSSTAIERSLPSSGFWKRTNVSFPADQAPIIDVRFTAEDGRPCMQTSYTLNSGSRISGGGCSNDGRTFYVKENGFDVVYHFDSRSHSTGEYNNTHGGTDNFEMKRL